MEAAMEPYYVCHENYYHHLLGLLKRLDCLMDCYVALTNNDFVLTHSFLLSAFSTCVSNLPKHSQHTFSYLVVKDLDPWGVRNVLEYLYTGTLSVPKHSVHSVVRTVQSLDIELGSELYETDDIVHYTLSQALKYDIINKIWLGRSERSDVKILTEGMHETYAHSAILSACSDQLFTLLRGSNNRPMLIVLLEFSYQDIETVLKFCYHGEVEIERARASDVCRLAKILGISDLYDTLNSLVTPTTPAESSHSKQVSKISCLEHKETTKKLFRTLFEKESLSDIQLICSDHTFKVHSAVLNLSPYFESLFRLSDWRHSLVFLSKMSLETVQAFVDYMYYGEVVYSGNVLEFTAAMQGLVDFSVMPINSVECQQVAPEVTEGVAEAPKHLTYTCDTCTAVFYSRRSLKLHLNTHPEAKSTKCSFCSQVFDKPVARRLHERSHTGSRPFVCVSCGKAYSSQSALGKHAKQAHDGSQVFHCELCGRTCSRKDYLEEHIRTHTGAKPFKCPTCGKQFVGKTGLNHHLKIHEPPKKDSVCEVCGKAFTRKALWTHMKTHDKQYKCDVCFKMFSTPGTLRAHTAMSHFENKLFPCDICGKKFALQNHLNRHKKNVHNPSRLYHCEKCPKILSSELKLSVHDKAKHANQMERTYECNVCSKKFAGRSALIYHERSHTGHRPHSCGVCTKSFLRPDALQKHLRSHTNERPYQCSLCEQRCSSKSALNNHVRRHNNKPAIPCNVCAKMFSSHSELSRHEAENHMEVKQKSVIMSSSEDKIPQLCDNKVMTPELCDDKLPVLQSLQSVPVPQYIQVYVPGCEQTLAQQPVIQMAVQQDHAQYIQVYVPSTAELDNCSHF